MSLHRFRLAYPLAIVSGLVLACGSSKTQTTSSTSTGNGQLALALVDEPSTNTTSTDTSTTTSTDATPTTKPPAPSQVWVSVREVKVHHSSSGWVNVKTFDSPLAVDVLKLQDSAQDLGLVSLPAGTINQIRLVLDTDGNHVVLADGTTEEPLKVPSGYQSGIKINGKWTISACTQTALTLAVQSIFDHPTGHDDLWILRPVIRVKPQVDDPIDCTTPPTPPAPVACDPAADPSTCAEGQACVPNSDTTLPVPGYCALPPGPDSHCTNGAECISGTCDPTGHYCIPSDPGQPCYHDSDCQSNSCDLESNVCNKGPIGADCDVDSDCASGLCDNLTCVEASSSGCTVDKLPPGSSCEGDDACQSLTCTNGLCALNGENEPCTSTAQCDLSLDPDTICAILDGACAGTCKAPPR